MLIRCEPMNFVFSREILLLISRVFSLTVHTVYLELLIQCGAETTVRTTTQSMTALHVLLLQGKKNADDTLKVLFKGALKKKNKQGWGAGRSRPFFQKSRKKSPAQVLYKHLVFI